MHVVHNDRQSDIAELSAVFNFPFSRKLDERSVTKR